VNASTTVRLLCETYDLASGAVEPDHQAPERLIPLLFARGLDAIQDGAAPRPVRGDGPQPSIERLNNMRANLFDAEVRYVVTKLRAFRLTQQHEQLERSWEALADVHAIVRQAVIMARAEEDRLKLRLASQASPEIPQPREEAPPPAQPNRDTSTRPGPYAHLFDGVSIVEVTVKIPPGDRLVADRLAAAHGWTDDWDDDADLVVVAYGLSTILREREAHEIDLADSASVEVAYQHARGRLMGLDSQSSILRFRLFELTKAVTILTWRVTALRTEIDGLRWRLEQFTAGRAELEARLVSAPAMPAPPMPEVREPVPSSTWRAYLSRMLRPLRTLVD
jgi:hypothetical protein